MSIPIQNPGPPLTEADLDLAEQRSGVRIPDAYRSFLLSNNGGFPEQPCAFVLGDNTGERLFKGTIGWFLGIGVKESVSLEYVLRTFQGRLPKGFFPIARDPGGNLIGLLTQGKHKGKIAFWDHEQEGDQPSLRNLVVIADDLKDLLENKLFKDE